MSRKKWFVKHPMQVKYLWMVAIAMLAPAAVVGFSFYHVMFRLMARQMAFPEAVASNIEPVVSRMNLFMAVTLPVVIAGIFLASLRLSHRFAGPLERLESELDRLLEGRNHAPIRVRENDDLAGVTRRINMLLQKLPKA